MSALPAGIYLVVDEDVCAASGRRPSGVAAAAVRAGVRVVQVRAKGASVRGFVSMVLEVADALRVSGPAVLIVDDRVDVALAARARGAVVDGVHVGQHDLEAADVRALLGPHAIVGVSAARLDHVRAVQAGVVDYVGTGPVRSTPTKADAGRPVGLDGLAAVVRATSVPVVAIGGLGLADLPAAHGAGAHGVAVVSAVCSAQDPQQAAAQLVQAWAAAQSPAARVVGAHP